MQFDRTPNAQTEVCDCFADQSCSLFLYVLLLRVWGGVRDFPERVAFIAALRWNFAGIAPTGKSIAMQACSVVEVRNGKAVRGRLYADNATLFQQLGVLTLPKAVSAG